MLPAARRRVVRLLAASAIAFFASNLHAQGVATSIDPIAIQEQIAANRDFNVAALWQALKVPAQLDTVYARVGVTPPDSARMPFDRCASACLAEIGRANVDDDPSDEVILTVYQEGRLCRFLVFKANATAAGVVQWRFLGYADHDALGQYEPEYRVSLVGGRRYFVVSAPGLHSAGMWVRYDRWYEVGPAGVHEVLSLPAEGLECKDRRSLCRAFGSTVVGSRNGPRGEEIGVSFTVRYWGDAFLLDENAADEIPLFSRSQRATFARPAKSTTPFTLAPLDSDIASWEVDAVFRLDALTCEDFLVSNLESLQQIGAGRPAASRTWLSRYVGGCAPSSQRTQLLELLK